MEGSVWLGERRVWLRGASGRVLDGDVWLRGASWRGLQSGVFGLEVRLGRSWMGMFGLEVRLGERRVWFRGASGTVMDGGCLS